MTPVLRLAIAGLFLTAASLGGTQAADARDAKDKKDPPKLELTEQEKQILDRTNEAREKENLPALKPNPVLTAVARAHSANMAKQGELKHVLDGKNPAERVREAGYDYSWVAENIAGGDARWPLADLFKCWMESKLHRENILGDKYEEIGIGVARDDNGKVYYTQVFGTHKKKK
jgi:uncharacterized protein YkwD